MSISVTCSNCGKTMSAPDDCAGKKAKCACGAIVEICACEGAEPQASDNEVAVKRPTASRVGSRSSLAARGGRGGRPSGAASTKCQECDSRMTAKGQFRRGTPLVVIGFILLACAFGGIMLSLSIMSYSGGVSTAISEATQDVSEDDFADFIGSVRNMHFPEDIAAKLESNIELTEAELEALTPGQRAFLQENEALRSMAAAGAEAARELGAVGADAASGLGKILAIIVLIPSLVFLLIGVLLVLRKKVLVCPKCGPVSA